MAALPANVTGPLIQPDDLEQVESRFILNIAVHQSPGILQLLASEKQQLVVRRNAYLLPDLSLEIGESVRALHLKRDDIAVPVVPVVKKDLHNENTSNQFVPPNKPEQKTSKKRGKNKLELVARGGWVYIFPIL
jgi:hypothetical protein